MIYPINIPSKLIGIKLKHLLQEIKGLNKATYYKSLIIALENYKTKIKKEMRWTSY